MVVAALLIAAACGSYVVKNRYYLRFVPVPVEFADFLRGGSGLFPASLRAEPGGRVSLGKHDLRTEEGLRATLDAIQKLSPTDPVNGLPAYADLTFDKWLKQVSTKPIFCTDGSQLVILAAWQQGLAAREWQLLPPGWPPGGGHSVVEFFNPSTGRWQLVDGQHAAIVRDENGRIMDMISVLKRYKEDPTWRVVVDYGPYRDQMLAGARGATVEHYFYEQALLDTPVLKLMQPTWLASVERRYGLTGHPVIGYAVLIDGWTHDSRVWTSKVALLGFLISCLAGGILLARLARDAGGRS